MSEWAAKRFWKEASVEETDGNYAVLLDGRSVKTPAKATLRVPTRSIAEAIAAEWQQVDEKIDPSLMPYTRSANAAIDKVSVQFQEVADMLAAYGESDLLCYRADSPEGLAARQAERWDPILDWAHQTYGGRLIPTAGIMPVTQDAAAVTALSAPLYQATPFALTAMHDLIALSGSLVLALAVTRGQLRPDEAWALSRVDEDWQSEQWGKDEEAEQAAEIKRLAFFHAAEFHHRLVDGRDG